MLFRSAAIDGLVVTVDSPGTNVDVTDAAQFQANTLRLRNIARSANLAEDTKEGCKKGRRTFQVSRMLCDAVDALGSDIELDILKPQLSETYYKSVAKEGSFDTPSVDIMKTMFSKKVSKSIIKAT